MNEKACKAELEMAQEELNQGIITMKEYNDRIRDIEREAREEQEEEPWL